MRILFSFLFFGIIYANKDKTVGFAASNTGVHTNKVLTDSVNKMKRNQLDILNEINDLKIEIDELKTDRTNQQSRINANEADISGNKANIFANSVDLQVLTFTSFPLNKNKNRLQTKCVLF